MISLPVYKVIHLLAVFLLFATIGGVAVHAANGGDKASNSARRLLAVLHGSAILILLVTGFGALARLGTGFDGWVWAKITIWVILGGVTMLPYRKPQLGRYFLVLLPLLGAAAAFFALFKPF